jgi:hypothetical protein
MIMKDGDTTVYTNGHAIDHIKPLPNPITPAEARALIAGLLNALRAIDTNIATHLQEHNLHVGEIATAAMGGPVPRNYRKLEKQEENTNGTSPHPTPRTPSESLAQNGTYIEHTDMQALLDISLILRSLLHLLSAPPPETKVRSRQMRNHAQAA